jgi:hypothetical protein
MAGTERGARRPATKPRSRRKWGEALSFEETWKAKARDAGSAVTGSAADTPLVALAGEWYARSSMSIDIQEAQRVLTIKLVGVVSEEDVTAFLQGIKTHLQRCTDPIAIVIDLTESDGGTAKTRQGIGEFFSAGGARFRLCAGMAAVAKSDGQQGFLRGILAMGPMPCPYRLFDMVGEASTWARTRLRETESPRTED